MTVTTGPKLKSLVCSICGNPLPYYAAWNRKYCDDCGEKRRNHSVHSVPAESKDGRDSTRQYRDISGEEE